MNPMFFITNNLGGGGTNVSRFIVYQDLFIETTAGLLLNYYYLENNFKKTVSFDQNVLAKIRSFNNIHDFLAFAADEFALDKKRISNLYTYSRPTWKPLTLLDSGSGNILRDISAELVKKTNSEIQKTYTNIISDYHNFAQSMGFDIVIGFDLPPKNTYKNSESSDSQYQAMLKRVGGSNELNHLLIYITLSLKNKFTHKIYAPLHGGSPEDFAEYYKVILSYEEEADNRFDGFALGGLGRQDISSIISHLRNTMREYRDNRPVHILGAGGIRKLEKMLAAGGTSFDCHTPWRRASDGSLTSGSPSKILIPKFDSKLNELHNTNELTYIDIDKLVDTQGCDCPICQEYNLEKIKKIYRSGTEDNYFAKILIFAHAIWQYEYVIRKSGTIKST